MTTPQYVQHSLDVELEKFDIPNEQIVAGDPQPRTGYVTYQTDRGAVTSGVFAMEPGTIRTTVAEAETVHVLEGEIRFELDDGTSLDLSPGDVVSFPPGTTTTRVIKTRYREHYVTCMFESPATPAAETGEA